MAKEQRNLTRESVQGFLKKSDETGAVPDAKQTKPIDKSSAADKQSRKQTGDPAKQRVTMVGRIGNTLAQGVKAELSSSDLHTRLWGFGIGASIALAALFIVPFLPFMESIHGMAYDTRMQLRFTEAPETGNIVHLDIENNSLQALGRWPWDRSSWVGVIQSAKDAGARRIVFDVEFDNRQAEEPDKNSMREAERWIDKDLRELLARHDDQIIDYSDGVGSLGEDAVREMNVIASEFRSAQTPEQREMLAQRLKEGIAQLRALAVSEPEKLAADIRKQGLKDQLPGMVTDIFKRILLDHDEALARAVREVGNVTLPVSFDSEGNMFTNPSREVAWTETLASAALAVYERAWQAEVERVRLRGAIGEDERSGLDAIRGADVVAALVSQGVGQEQAIRAEAEARGSLRRLFLYRVIRSWYMDKPDSLVREHMRQYLANSSQAATELRTAPGEVFEGLRGVVGSSKTQWGEQAVVQLQKFYSWYLIQHGAEGKKPSSFPLSIVEGYNPDLYDPWAAGDVREEFRESNLPHYRDIEMNAPIFTLADPAECLGTVSIAKDKDGKLRKIQLLSVYVETVSQQHCLLLNIGFRSLLDDVRADLTSLRVVPGKHLLYRADSRVVEALRAARPASEIDAIPLADPKDESIYKTYGVDIDERGMMRINWAGSSDKNYSDIFRHLPVVSLYDSAAANEETRRLERKLDKLREQTIETFLSGDYRYDRQLSSAAPLHAVVDVPFLAIQAMLRSIPKEKSLSEAQLRALIDPLRAAVGSGSQGVQVEATRDAFVLGLSKAAGLSGPAGIEQIMDALGITEARARQAFGNIIDVVEAGLRYPLGQYMHVAKSDQPEDATPLTRIIDSPLRADFTHRLLALKLSLFDAGADYAGARAALRDFAEGLSGTQVVPWIDSNGVAVSLWAQLLRDNYFQVDGALRALLFDGGHARAASPDSAAAVELLRWEVERLRDARVLNSSDPLLSADPADLLLAEFPPVAQAMRAFRLAIADGKAASSWEVEARLVRLPYSYLRPNRVSFVEYFGFPFFDTRTEIEKAGGVPPKALGELMAWLRKRALQATTAEQRAELLVEFKHRFKQVLGLDANAPDARLPKAFVAADGSVELWRVLSANLETPLGSRYHKFLPRKEFKIFTPEEQTQLTNLLVTAMDGLLEETFDFSGHKQQVWELVKAKTGAYPEDLPEEHRALRVLMTETVFGRVFVGGAALRELLFDREHLVSDEERGFALANPGSERALAIEVKAAWERDRLGSAGVLPADDPAFALSGHELLEYAYPAGAKTLRAFRFNRNEYLKGIETGREIYREKLRSINDYAHLQGSFVLVGAAATALSDIVSTPLHGHMPGPAVHSNTYRTLAYSDDPRTSAILSAVLGALVALVVCFVAVRFSIKWSIAGFVVLAAGYQYIDLTALSHSRAVFDTVANLSAITLPLVGIQGYRYAVEYRAKLKLKGQFGKYLDPSVVEEMQKNPPKLGGDEKEVAVYFSDIAGFTPISESMTPQRLIMFLNDYMTRMCEPIRESKGTIDKFIGDATMAFWGAPIELPDHSARACKSAVRGTQILRDWNREREARGELKVGARIGIATGPMVVGNMGTDYKLNYTAIGDTVNLASRLEGANKQYGTQCMVNQLCYEQSKDMVVAHIMDNIAVKGKKKGVPVYHLIGLVGETDMNIVEGCAIYTQAFELYQKEQWAPALELFKKAKPLLPPPYMVEYTPSDLMMERCEALIKATPQERMEILHLKSEDAEWDGVWKLTSK